MFGSIWTSTILFVTNIFGIGKLFPKVLAFNYNSVNINTISCFVPQQSLFNWWVWIQKLWRERYNAFWSESLHFFSHRDLWYNRHYTWTSPYIFLILTDIKNEDLKLIMSFTKSKNSSWKWNGIGLDTAKLVNFETWSLGYLRLRQEFTSLSIDAKALISES